MQAWFTEGNHKLNWRFHPSFYTVSRKPRCQSPWASAKAAVTVSCPDYPQKILLLIDLQEKNSFGHQSETAKTWENVWLWPFIFSKYDVSCIKRRQKKKEKKSKTKRMQCEPIIVTELQRMEVCPVLAGQSGVLSPHRPVSYTSKCQCTGPERTIPFGL